MSPFTQIWINTSASIDYFLTQEKSKGYVYEFIWIGAISLGFVYLIEWHKGLGIVYFILASVFWVLFLRFIFPAILKVVGDLMNGQASFEQLQIIVSLACIPFVIEILYLFLTVIIPGKQPLSNPIISSIASVFSIRILVTGLAKAQKIPDTFAFMNWLIPYSLFVLLLILFEK